MVVAGVIDAQGLIALRRYPVAALLVGKQAFDLLARLDGQSLRTPYASTELVDVSIVQYPEIPLSIGHGETQRT